MTIYEIRRGGADLEIDTMHAEHVHDRGEVGVRGRAGNGRFTGISVSSDHESCTIVLGLDGLASVHEAIGRRLAALRARA